MAKLPDIHRDPTLDAVDAAIEAAGNAEKARPYLGMSSIGRSCSRELWYGFRWASGSTFDAASLKRFEDGHRTEDLQAERLRMAPGVTLTTIDPRTGRQFGFADIGGHFRGHADGIIDGLLQATKTRHVWEHKATNDAKQAKLAKAISDLGEKQALASWDAVYHAQAQLYMHYAGLTRHYLTCSNAGGRHTISVRTDADRHAAAALIEKARAIIAAAEPPERISDRPDWYECKWCQHHATCHQTQEAPALPLVNCRTCAHATPETDGDGRWSCARYGIDPTVEQQRLGCSEHVYIPALLPWGAVDADDEAGWIEYQAADGTTFRNGPGFLSSSELRAAPRIAIDTDADAVKKPSAESGLMMDPIPPASTPPDLFGAPTAGITSETQSDQEQGLGIAPKVTKSTEHRTASTVLPPWQT